MDKFVGKRLDGRYEIREIIGVGGMAVVYKAYDCIEDRIVAVKILKEEFISNEEFISRFKNESKAIAVLNHPNIVKVYDVSFGDLIQYIVMEYVDGVTLKQYIGQQASLRWKDAVYLTIQVLRALQHAHDKGIVHRDVKPQNIMLLSDGTIKVTDFGIARFARSEHKTMTDKAIGSVHYISPGQARGEQTDEKADIYSVGVMLYEMLTGRLPFEAESAVSVAIMQLQKDPVLPREINDTIPLGLEQITMHAMQKDFNKRYRSAAEMLRDLEEFRRSPDMEFGYTYFVDEEPTRFVDAAAVAAATTQSTETVNDINNEYDEEEDDENEKSPIIPILAGVAIAFVATAIIVAIIIFGLLGKRTTSLEVPKLVGLDYSVLQTDDRYDAFTFDVEFEYSDTVEKNKIISQSFPEGRKIKKTQVIKIVVSSGPEGVRVPELFRLTESNAIAELEKAGFKYSIHRVYDEDIEEGRVISTNPAADELTEPGQTINVFISNGKKKVYLTDDEKARLDLEGRKVDEARELIESLGLTVKIENKDDELPAGTVLAVSPDSNAKEIEKGSEITLTVSTGVINYEYDLTVDLSGFNFNDTYKTIKKLSVYIGDVEVGSVTEPFDANTAESKIFKIKSTSKTVEAVVIIDFDADDNYDLVSEEGAFTYIINMANKTDEIKKDSIKIPAEVLEPNDDDGEDA